MEDITAREGGASVPASAGTDALPCLRSNNSIEEPPNEGNPPVKILQYVEVSKSAFKTEFCLKQNIEFGVKRYGLENLAFFTVTFAYPIYSAKRAQKHINSILTNVIRPRYGNRYVCVFERHASDAIHFHFLLWVGEDIRTGFDWSLAELAYEAGKKRDYVRARKLWVAATEKASGGTFLRGEWSFWRGLKERYRWLGRCEMLPIKSTAEAIARYTGNYISKHMQHRREEDKGIRLARYGKGMCWARSRLAFNSPKGRVFRRKLAAFAAQPRIALAGVHEYADMKRVFGKRWGYHLMPAILAMELDFYPTGEDARADGHDVPVDCVDVRITRQRSNDPEIELWVYNHRLMEIKRRLFAPRPEN